MMGQALVFSLATVHGSTHNGGTTTRWSTDIRMVNALAPVDLSGRPDYYEVLSSSVVSDRARAFELAAVVGMAPPFRVLYKGGGGTVWNDAIFSR